MTSPLLLHGDALPTLRTLKTASVHLCITSPPYLGLRDYRVAERGLMIGLEPTWAEHLAALLGVFGPEGVMRVLRPDGVLVINYGDKYASGTRATYATDKKLPERAMDQRGGDEGAFGLGLPDKCRMALPERLLIALIDQGWIYRAASPWVKRNGLPDSAADRPGANIENIYLFAHPASRGRTYWDAEAVRQTYAPASVARAEGAARNGGEAIDHQAPGQPKTGVQRVISHPGRSMRMGDLWVASVRGIVGCEHGEAPRYTEANQSWARDAKKEADVPGARSKQNRKGRKRTAAGRRDGNFDEVYDAAHPERAERSHDASPATGGLALNESGEPIGLYLSTQGFNGAKLLADFIGADGKPYFRAPGCPHHGKNGARTFQGDCRCELVTEDHYATFPEALVEPFILAGTSEKGCCPACGAPWVRVVEVKEHGSHPSVKDSGGIDVLRNLGHDYETPKTTGWRPGCACKESSVDNSADNMSISRWTPDPVPCTVLDPFSGTGTTVVVADRLGRHGVGIDLNPKYIAMARKRLEKDAPLFHAQGASI